MRYKHILFLAISFIAVAAKADSPLTSTYFATSYYEYPLVISAESVKEITPEIAAYLLDEKNPIDVKVAIINAIGWNYESTSNAKTFREYIAKAHSTATEKLTLSDLRWDELVCLGYLTAMDDYFVADEAINILETAVAKKSSSYTANLLLAMVKGQKAMDTDFCKVWTVTREVIKNDDLKRDMKTTAIQTIVDYMILYKPDCEEVY